MTVHRRAAGRCPLCADNTKITGGFERCVRPACDAHTIERNPRGESERARNRHGQVVYQRRSNSAPDDTAPGARRIEWLPMVGADSLDVVLATPINRMPRLSRKKETITRKKETG